MSPFLIISGMHRSGTSFLARALNLSGVYLGRSQQLTHTDVNPHPTNAYGHWEHERLQSLADETLALTGGTWDDVPETIKVTEEIGSAVADEVRLLQTPVSFASGFKDPRTLLVYDAWQPYLPEDAVMIAIFRDPESVVRSLDKRDGFDRDKSLRLWSDYNRRLLDLIEREDGYLLDFSWPVEQLSKELAWICEQLHLPYIGIEQWYNPRLVTEQEHRASPAVSAEIAQLYQALQDRALQNRSFPLALAAPTAETLAEISKSLLQRLEEQALFFRKVHDADEAQALIERQQAYINYLEDKHNIEALNAHIANLQASLDAIENSRTWKILRWIDKLLGRPATNTH
ncbi:MAG: hypothetical protein R3330_04575 [Saprospiraceae bacterium]|nr:hypothetical protein [Saprospiraceae bacterium]